MNMNILNYNSEEREKILLTSLRKKEYNKELIIQIIENMSNQDLNYIKHYIFLYLGKREGDNLLIEIINKFNNRFNLLDILNKNIINDYKEEIILNLYLNEINEIKLESYNIDQNSLSLIEKIKIKQMIEIF